MADFEIGDFVKLCDYLRKEGIKLDRSKSGNIPVYTFIKEFKANTIECAVNIYKICEDCGAYSGFLQSCINHTESGAKEITIDSAFYEHCDSKLLAYAITCYMKQTILQSYIKANGPTSNTVFSTN